MLSLVLLLQEPGGEQGFTPFSINSGLIFWTILVFGLLLVVLWRLGWPALLKSVEDRERRIQQQLDEAERARAEAMRLLEEHVPSNRNGTASPAMSAYRNVKFARFPFSEKPVSQAVAA